MSQQLNAAVKKAIRDNLKGEVGESLKLFIEEAEKTKLALERKEREHEILKKDCESLRAQIKKQSEIEANLIETKRLADFVAEDRKQAEFLRIEARALVAEAKLQATENVVNMVFRNTVIREGITRSVPIAVPGTPAGQYSNGTTGFVQQGNIETETITRTAD